MNNNISLQELIAFNSTQKAKRLIIKYGYRPARSYNDLIKKLVQFTMDYQDEALKELVKLHPHKDLILYFNESEEIPLEEKKSSCNGDDMCEKCLNKQNFLSFEGQKDATQKDYSKIETIFPYIALTSLITAVLVVGLKA